MLNPFTHRKILKKGTPGRATIVAMGALDRGATSFNLPMTLHVYVEGMTPYEVEGQWMVKAKDTIALSGSIPVKVDPKEPEDVAIDWEVLRAEHEREEDQRRQALAAQGPVTDLTAAADPFAALSAQADGSMQGATPVLDISGDPELRKKLEQLLGRELTPGSTETVAQADPALQMRIMQTVQEHMAQKAMGGFAASAGQHGGTGAPAAGGPDPAERLRKLRELRDGGLISYEEFEQKKDEILRGL